jgi:pimeloyl-ACP methyl ester carboxylesterase
MSLSTQHQSFWTWTLRIGSIGVIVIVVLFLGLAVNQRIALRRFRERTLLPGQLVDVDGHRMHIRCTGSGTPTVVIDAGNACFGLEWTPIQERLAETTRVCTYDRAGYGWSDAGPSPRDGATAVAELHTLLQAASEPGPYVLVGHSLGGIHARLFTTQYPDEVAGLVLVDTAAEYTLSPEREAEMRASIGFYQVMHLLTGSGLLRVLGPLGGEGSMPETARKLPDALQETYLNLLLDQQQYATAIAEMTQLGETLRQTGKAMNGAHPLANRPLIVLTAGQRMAPGSTPFDDQLVPVSRESIDAQSTLAALSSQGEQRLIEQSGHQIHLDAPEAVIAAVHDVIQMIR